MKEFIDKLIERLEEEKQRLRKLRNNTVTLTDHEVCAIEEGAFNFCKKAVNELAEEYNGGWIPCSERLPNKEEYLKDDGRFIVTDGNRVYQSIYDIYIHHWFRTLKLFNFGAGENPSYEVDNCVIAWMPLPEPYKERE